MQQYFDVEKVGKGAAILDPSKLDWIGQEWLKKLDTEAVAQRLCAYLDIADDDLVGDFREAARTALDSPTKALLRLIEELVPRSNKLADMLDLAAFLFRETIVFEDKMETKFIVPENLELFTMLREILESVEEPWTGEAIKDALTRLAERREVGFGKVAQPLRVALTGRKVAPPITETVAALGKERTRSRLASVIERLGG